MGSSRRKKRRPPNHVAAGIGRSPKCSAKSVGISRRQWLIGSGLATVACVLPFGWSRASRWSDKYWVCHDSLDTAYAMARKDPALRQVFLDRILDENPFSLCSRIVYDPGYRNVQEYLKSLVDRYVFDPQAFSGDPLASVVMPISVVGCVLCAPIFVGDCMFTESDHPAPVFRHPRDLLSTIVDHEYQHVEDVCLGYRMGDLTITHEQFPGPLYPTAFLTLLKEVRGYDRQVRSTREVSSEVRRNVVMRAKQHYAELADARNCSLPLVAMIARKQLEAWPEVGVYCLGPRRFRVELSR
ncbi:hypothetical protein GF342_02665 [Candidatus Woesearchaeota archaeon]|nr:hypothetical protein [Candidatus Woesearchaeota archaeon]